MRRFNPNFENANHHNWPRAHYRKNLHVLTCFDVRSLIQTATDHWLFLFPQFMYTIICYYDMYYRYVQYHAWQVEEFCVRRTHHRTPRSTVGFILIGFLTNMCRIAASCLLAATSFVGPNANKRE